MLVLGDAHASDPDRRDALLAAYDAADADVALQLGDLELYDLPIETWFVAGNNEDLDVIEALREGRSPDGVRNVNLLASTTVELAGLQVTGLSGNHAPTRYDHSRDELAGDRRRHFTRDDVEALAAVGERVDVDVLLTHEAPHGLLHYGYDPGCEHVDELLSTLDPDLCLVGHHERHAEATIRGCRVVSLAPAWESYYDLDPDSLALERYETPT